MVAIQDGNDDHADPSVPMRAYVVRRAAQMVFVVLGVIAVTFFAVRLVPGDPARIMNRPGTPESVLKITREELGTD